MKDNKIRIQDKRVTRKVKRYIISLECSWFLSNEGVALLTHPRQVVANNAYQILTMMFQLSMNGHRGFCWLCVRSQILLASQKHWKFSTNWLLGYTVLHMKVILKFIKKWCTVCYLTIANLSQLSLSLFKASSPLSLSTNGHKYFFGGILFCTWKSYWN